MNGRVSTRSATASDADFLFRVYASTRDDITSLTAWSDDQKDRFLREQHQFQSAAYRQTHPDADYRVALLDEHRVGRLYVDRGRRALRIIDIALLPAYRGMGIGTVLLNALRDEARRAGKTLVLHVEHGNPAYRLYTQLGFRDVADDSLGVRMEWAPDGATSATNAKTEGVAHACV